MRQASFLVERDLEAHIVLVRRLADQAAELRQGRIKELPLRDMMAWGALRAAQDWIARHGVPIMAWEGERVRRTALQIGYARPVAEGKHIGLMRPRMSFNHITQEVAVYPAGIIDRRIPPIASTLIHEATHAVTRERFCERFGFTQDEAFVLCDLNDRERPRDVFTAEALAFWNQACWMVAYSPYDVGEGGRHEMVLRATHATTRSRDAILEFAEALEGYAAHALSEFRHTGFEAPLVWHYGTGAGYPIRVSDLAPAILEPLFEVLSESEGMSPLF